MPYTVLLSAEQCSESDSEDWIREATEEEIAEERADYPGLKDIDDTGRPYNWRSVDFRTAPKNVRLQITRNLRIFRW